VDEISEKDTKWEFLEAFEPELRSKMSV
jgi:hypothetical protein